MSENNPEIQENDITSNLEVVAKTSAPADEASAKTNISEENSPTEKSSATESLTDTLKSEENQSQPSKEDNTSQNQTQPQIIIQKERGFAHYVGFALLCVLCIFFFFAPGIAITFAISLIPGISLGAIAAWTFSALLSVIAWFIFKLKIKGIKKSFYFYIGLCILVTILLVVIEVLTEKYALFANILSLLTGANA